VAAGAYKGFLARVVKLAREIRAGRDEGALIGPVPLPGQIAVI
jgi:hypothetical protein